MSSEVEFGKSDVESGEFGKKYGKIFGGTSCKNLVNLKKSSEVHQIRRI